MSSEDISDPRAYRWVESGVSGLARPREWELIAVAEVPELEGDAIREVEFRRYADGTLRVRSESRVPAAALEALAWAVEDAWDADPYTALAVRRDARTWVVGANEWRGELVTLPVRAGAESLEVARPPDGDATFLVDGEEVIGLLDADLRAAQDELERRGRARFQSFVARADRLDDDRWELTIDPL